ncbi:Uu.00g047330.m01.CDS01 [Anthostomella pinea]|uniref:tRNA-splicing endonuclease subunit Sen34 n=1 Tax=Anthostomella pinea TaxID=933095 RepID=A0AAI8VCH1_9PEZI|nr:Uu.00g047330.m01.CDS01 [Anthostomella pinea]
MTSSTSHAPLRISKLAGRYLIFDIDDVMYLRRNHNMCSVFTGTTPQNPQQNVFMGLPLELMPEEVKVLVDKHVAYVADDAAFHPARLASLDAPSRQAYLQTLKDEGRAAYQEFVDQQRRKPKPSQVKAKNKKSEPSSSTESPRKGTEDEEEASLFDSSPAPTPADPTPKPEAEPEGYAVTHTTSSLLLTQQPPHQQPITSPIPSPAIEVPASYPLYAHLQHKGYYMMPGLRFGCDYNVYPGDPLRFHSHFQATHHGWEEEITMLDIVAGGRLGTGVKKGYLLGGAVSETHTEHIDGNDTGRGVDITASHGKGGDGTIPHVRTFCIEWAGM